MEQYDLMNQQSNHNMTVTEAAQPFVDDRNSSPPKSGGIFYPVQNLQRFKDRNMNNHESNTLEVVISEKDVSNMKMSEVTQNVGGCDSTSKFSVNEKNAKAQ